MAKLVLGPRALALALAAGLPAAALSAPAPRAGGGPGNGEAGGQGGLGGHGGHHGGGHDHVHLAGGETPPAAADEAAGAGGGGGPGGFCNGEAEAMSMTGFTTALSPRRGERPCVVFLVGGLVLDTPGKFACGCTFASSLGMAIEGLMAASRQLTPSGAGQRLARAGLHAVTLLLGYMVMLLVMTYSLEITVSAILGLCFGRLLAEGAGAEKGAAPDGSERMPCCPG